MTYLFATHLYLKEVRHMKMTNLSVPKIIDQNKYNVLIRTWKKTSKLIWPTNSCWQKWSCSIESVWKQWPIYVTDEKQDIQKIATYLFIPERRHKNMTYLSITYNYDLPIRTRKKTSK